MRKEAIECDVAVIGAGLGGVAAALTACDAGASVVLSEPTDWLGGQATAHGVSALDEHARIEDRPPSDSFHRFRDGIRADYVAAYGVPPTMPNGQPLNPGNGWVSRLCFDPRVGVRVIEAMLAPHVWSGRLQIIRLSEPVAATVEQGRVRGVTLRGANGDLLDIHARYVLDASELGDMLPLTGTPYVTGAESRADTAEPNAADEARPGEVQSFTYCFAAEYRPGESHVIDKPAGYEHMRDSQPYSLTIHGPTRRFGMFAPTLDVALPFWTYRRLLDAALLDPTGTRGLHDNALINWPGNDYHDASLIDVPPAERLRAEHAAKQLSLGFLYWLQTECPRDDGGAGYPELRLAREVMGTEDGLSKGPYIRESRRIVPLFRILEQHVAAAGRERAEVFADSVGIGWYQLDLHPAVGNPNRHMFAPTHPFQIPLGALIPRPSPRTPDNLIAACKNIGTTHISNGAYRLHPVEWAIGEAAGALAAYCIAEDVAPAAVWTSSARTRALQQLLINRGVRVAWPPL